jgi:probable F420-dependent oxidoreductase
VSPDRGGALLTVSRIGLTIPFASSDVARQREAIEGATDLGYTDLWTSETNESDGLTPLALAAGWGSPARLGSAILPVQTRGPALLAMSISAMAQAAPGRFVAGIGASSPTIVRSWNAMPFDTPLSRVRDTLRFLREALTGAKVTRDYQTFSVSGFRLGSTPGEPPPLYLAALREGALRLAGEEADGVILNWLAAQDVGRVAAVVKESDASKEVIARLFVCPSTDTATVGAAARRHIAAYLTVPTYRAFHEWLGRGAALDSMWQAWDAGDRKAALAAIPNEIVNSLIIHGSPAQCHQRIREYLQAGVDTAIVQLMPWGMTQDAALSGLGPVTASVAVD